MDVLDRPLHGLPCLHLGSGPPLLVLSGLSPEHASPSGFDRRLQLRMVGPYAERFRVLLANRRPGLPVGTTMHDLAAHVAEAIRAELAGRVPVMGVSTGGSIALQLAVDHPDVVERLVVASSACRLGPQGRDAQRRLGDLTEAGEPRAAWASMAPTMVRNRMGRRALAAMLWVFGPMTNPDDPSDMVTTIRAEDAFDVTADLGRITARTLVVGGGHDGFSTTDLFEATADGIPGARLVLQPGKGHVGVLTDRPTQQAVLEFLLA